MTHTGLPIVVSLANKAVSFSCRITYPYTPKFKDFTVSYFHVDLQGQRSSEEKTSCKPGPGRENQTNTKECQITPKLPGVSATGTYYCSVRWPDSTVTGNGTFILVRGELPPRPFPGRRAQRFHPADSGAQEPKWGTFASLFSFGKTEQSSLGEPLAAQVCRDAHLCVARAEAWGVDLATSGRPFSHGPFGTISWVSTEWGMCTCVCRDL